MDRRQRRYLVIGIISFSLACAGSGYLVHVESRPKWKTGTFAIVYPLPKLQAYSLGAALDEDGTSACFDTAVFVPPIQPVLVADREVMVIAKSKDQPTACVTISRGQFHTAPASHAKGTTVYLETAEDLAR